MITKTIFNKVNKIFPGLLVEHEGRYLIKSRDFSQIINVPTKITLVSPRSKKYRDILGKTATIEYTKIDIVNKIECEDQRALFMELADGYFRMPEVEIEKSNAVIEVNSFVSVLPSIIGDKYVMGLHPDNDSKFSHKEQVDAITNIVTESTDTYVMINGGVRVLKSDVKPINMCNTTKEIVNSFRIKSINHDDINNIHVNKDGFVYFTALNPRGLVIDKDIETTVKNEANIKFVTKVTFEKFFATYCNMDSRNVENIIDNYSEIEVSIVIYDDPKAIYNPAILTSGTGSCMAGDSKDIPDEIFDIYRDNGVKGVACVDSNGKIRARALLWAEVVANDGSSKFPFLDRIYKNQQKFETALIRYAKEQGWATKRYQDAGSYAVNLPNGCSYHGGFWFRSKNQITPNEYGKVPYLDTLGYGVGDILFSGNSWKMRNTGWEMEDAFDEEED